MNYKQNNLNLAKSPYLLQHKDNPIWWQEWNNNVLEYARENNKLIFVSSGYSTCHWCHVMANDSFSDTEIANALNSRYVCIKIDREERPDIDHFLMSFMSEMYGSGGWPLNVIMTPDKKPFFAGTYIGKESKYGMPSFLELLDKIEEFYIEKSASLKNYSITQSLSSDSNLNAIENSIKLSFDGDFGGFGNNMKFPPHNTLLFMLHNYEEKPNPELKSILIKTLSSISQLGLHDHLQGGFYRYCVDRQWTIPHFEKMLYDQAMLLMIFSTAYKIFDDDLYKSIAYKIISCLNNTFKINGLYCSAFDADTDHIEGDTYLWNIDEISDILNEKIDTFNSIYTLVPFEGKNHLHKKDAVFTDEIDTILLDTRNKRIQPFKDEKILTSWNSLTGIALIYAYRSLNDENLLKMAIDLFDNIKNNLFKDGLLYHSMLNGELSNKGFLEDYASFLLFTTYINEENEFDDDLINLLKDKVESFKIDNIWYESIDSEIGMVPAKEYDHPTPSSVSLAEMAILRASIILGLDYKELTYKDSLNYDYHNLAVLVSQGIFYQVFSLDKIKWNKFPINTIQIIENHYKSCYKGSCRIFDTQDQMLENLKS
jgi:uncharacterized protein YyaL (SSP411 family)